MSSRPTRIATIVALVMLAIGCFASYASAGTTGTIQGFVTDPSGRALAGVHVSVASPTSTTTTTTGANGYYVITGLPVDTYRVTFSKQGFEPLIIAGVTVVQDQNRRVDGSLSASIKTLGNVTVRGQTSVIQPTQTADTYTVTQSVVQNINGTPQDLNGFQAFNSLPGVTTDNFGYPIIRAGQENDVGYEYEGVDNTDPVTGQFLNGLSLNGTRSIQLSTGGYDVSNGNTNSGVINQVITRGAYPGSGQATVRITGPLYGHELSMDWGNATPDNRFSYYFSFGGQRDAAGYGNLKDTLPFDLNFTNFVDTDDTVANMYYHFGKNQSNELQFLSDVTAGDFIFGLLMNPNTAPYASANGNVRLAEEVTGPNGNPIGNITEADYLTPFPGQVANNQFIKYPDSQSFNSAIDKFQFKRQLSSSSFVETRVHQTIENLIFNYPYDVGSFSDFYEDLQTQGLGAGFDYTNQLSSRHSLGVGADYTVFKSLYSAGVPSFEPFDMPLEGTSCVQLLGFNDSGGCYIAPLNAAIDAIRPGFNLPTSHSLAPLTTFPSDLSYVDDPVHRMNFYVKDLWQPSDRFTADIGVRFDKQIYSLPPDVPQQNMYYTFDDNFNFVTHLGAPIGTNVTQPQQISPRLGLTYKLSDRDVLRFSYGKNIEFEPESGIENKYRIDPALANCTVGTTPNNGCFHLLQGAPYPGMPGFIVGPNPNQPVPGTPTNNITNLYQQILIDQNTNNFAQYTPVLPQRAVNYDMSFEHAFGSGFELKVSPYYRKGTDYVVGSSSLLFTLPSGTPVFGPFHFSNAGINKNFGVEFDLQREASTGLTGFLNFTYDNTLANYDGDFFPFVNDAALASGQMFHVSYVAPVTGTFNLAYDSPNGWHVSMNMPYESGYPYGVGKKVWVFANFCDPSLPAIPVKVLNTDLAENTCGPGTSADAYYFTDPANPGTVFQPNITASRGTPEGDDPGSIRGIPVAFVNLTVAHELGRNSNGTEVGIRVENILGNYTGSTGTGTNPGNNGFYVPNGLGSSGPGSGFNPNQCAPGQTLGCEPFMYNLGRLPYENEANSPVPRVWTFFISTKY
ncbi:MAG TPA: TonB-dependent receptor [Candidatus Eremiobacteraceae bacterium]|nr:TonB-dependent receptor [Candidatus Eremiobacteraceae bacterium]